MTLTDTPSDQSWRDVFVSADDGLKLHARDYGSRTSSALPVLCLPGLTRNAHDFHTLAVYLSCHEKKPRRVVALESRGRGQSEWDKNWRNYDAQVEARDVLSVMPALGLDHVGIVGTSRGGILTMILAVTRPGILAGVVLNDIGPVLGGKGLARIKGYVGKTPKVHSWQEAAQLSKTVNEGQFPNLDDQAWMDFARRTYIEENGQIRPDYDPALGRPFESLDLTKPVITLWPQFEALRYIETLVVHGENSDLLEPETLTEMRRRHEKMDVLECPGEGHAPLLDDAMSMGKIYSFFSKLDH
jgi:pimeloyl-ACP methyl ester carboxylesterase